jgi:hypothetical protein
VSCARPHVLRRHPVNRLCWKASNDGRVMTTTGATGDGVTMKSTSWARHRSMVLRVAGAVVVATAATAAPAQQGPPAFSKAFQPDVIGPGSVAVLRFDISNLEGGPVTGLAFTDTLPAGVAIASPAGASTTCGGELTAANGGGTISFSGGSLGAGAACSIRVNATSSTLGVHTNVSGDLTSSAGNSGNAADDLTVAADRPGFSKAFSPSAVAFGGRSTLTFTVDNSANPSALSSLSFSDALPLGMVIASPANASTDCQSTIQTSTLTAVPGTGLVALSAFGFLPSYPVLAAGATCTVNVDVIGGAVGMLFNTSGELTSASGGPTRSSGAATAALEVTATPIALVKSFTDDPVPPGGTVELQFTIANLDRGADATAISFSDDLDATLTGLTAVGLPMAGVCGPGSQLAGTGLLTLTGGTLAAEAQCSFSVTLQVPAGAATGAYPNTTSSISADLGGVPVTGTPGADILFVAAKEFTDDPVGAGGTVNLEFTITNTSLTSTATGITFTDELTSFLGSPLSVTLPGPSPCGAGSSLTLAGVGFGQGLSLNGGSLGPGASCTFSADIGIPAGQSGGTYTNVTSPITATVDASPVVGNPAMDDLVVVAAPRLVKEFTEDPAQPGGTTTLEFTLSHDELAAGDATGIGFTDDLDAVVGGLAAVGLPQADVCGPGSQISGTSTLSFAGGSLAPGEQCSFAVSLQVPTGAAVGSHANTTGSVTATVAGVATTGSPATDELMIAGLALSKEFTDDPALPGGTATLRFTIENLSAAEAATGIVFQDALSGVLGGLAASGLPLLDVCGVGSSLTGLSGNTLLSFLGGSLGPGASCQFDVTLEVPAAAPSGSYANLTSGFSATMGGSTVAFPNAADQLEVSAEQLDLTKEFTDDPVAPGGTATLEFTLTNLHPSLAATGITFTDDLDAALAGLTAVGLPAADICGAGSQLSGTSLLTFTGGNLPAGGSCTFSVLTQVPASVPWGAAITNVTSAPSGSMSGLPVTGGAASGDLAVEAVAFSKSFAGPAIPGGRTTLTFVIENLSAGAGVTGLAFTDDLEAALAGLAAVGLPAVDVCGAGSEIAGTSLLTLRDGTLGPGESCTIEVEVEVPPSAIPGSYANVTSELFVAGVPSAAPATAALEVQEAAAAAIPAATPLGSLLLMLMIITAAAWLLRFRS